eukprot:GHVQ01014182.1.p1 GENE.GHVQ01014182.1~~GHVQ01014182.1.p1  ORF type:complete len:134 (-),score=12.12 GHVQ01014182.1:887-1288(-)
MWGSFSCVGHRTLYRSGTTAAGVPLYTEIDELYDNSHLFCVRVNIPSRKKTKDYASPYPNRHDEHYVEIHAPFASIMKEWLGCSLVLGSSCLSRSTWVVSSAVKLSALSFSVRECGTDEEHMCTVCTHRCVHI